MSPDTFIDEVWLDQFLGKIFFLSHSLVKVRRDSKASKFRVFTKHWIPLAKLSQRIEAAFPECTVKPYLFYNKTHTVDVRTNGAITWRDFIWTTVNALESYL